MVTRGKSRMTRQRWLRLARSKKVRNPIVRDGYIDNFQAVLTSVGRRKVLDWEEVVAILHMVYGWMPTMLRNIGARTVGERNEVVNSLRAVKAGKQLTVDELAKVSKFANGSIVGASKLLHAICPTNFAIWDARVASAFLWKGVSRSVYCQPERYLEYMTALRAWSADSEVIQECSKLRNDNSKLSAASDIRLIELVLFHSG